MKNFFDIAAPVYEKIHIGAKETFDRIESLVVFRKTDGIIDLGGGTGRIASFFKNKVKKVTVVDTSEAMLKQCRRRHPELSCLRAEAHSLPIPDNSIDKIIIVDAFHHFKNQRQVVKEIQRVLSAKGKIIIAEFNPLTTAGRIIRFIEKLLLMGSIFHSPSSLAYLFSSNGFNVQLIDEGKASYYLIGEKAQRLINFDQLNSKLKKT